MAGRRGVGGTLGDVLRSRRRRCFVGRDAELELVRAALDAEEPPFSVLWFTGPGGIGKTSLLDVIAEEAARAGGSSIVRLDARDLEPSPSAVLEALEGVPRAGDALVPPEGRLVLLFDAYERLGALDDWVRTWLLPSLPASALTVVAGRDGPGSAWRADPAWRGLLRVVALRNLGPEESRRYLQACGLDDAVHGGLIDVSHGHPLGLSLLADVVIRGVEVAVSPLAPDLVGTLVRRFVDVVPVDSRRRALEVCALARVTTEALLRDTVAVDDAPQVFAWLRDLSFIEEGPEGLFPHDLARDVIDADLRWRDPEGYKTVFRRVRAHISATLRSTSGRDQQRAVFDLKYVFRKLPSVLSPVDWDVWGQRYHEPARPGDKGSILELLSAAEGQDSAAIAQRWLDLQPEAFVVIRRDDDVQGVIALVDLTKASAEDRGADPGASAAWEFAHRHAPPWPGEVITLTRFLVDRDVYQGPSPTLNAIAVATLQRYLATPRLAWDFLALHEPEPWDEFFALADLPRATGADFVVGGRRYGLFGHDFRRVRVDALMELWTERALAQDPTLSPTAFDDALALSQAEFSDAVRQALRDLHRPDLLARNPLLRTRVARHYAATDEPDADALEGLLWTAVNALRQHPRDDKLLRALDRTYLRPAPTQEAAAEVLDVPFSTYRRHLTQGVGRIVAYLWDREVYGMTSGSAEHH
jgi:hypothetical protein